MVATVAWPAYYVFLLVDAERTVRTADSSQIVHVAAELSLRSAMKEQRSAGVAGGRGSRRSTSRDRTVSVEILEVAGVHVPQCRARLSLANRKSPLSAQHRAGHKHVIDQGCSLTYCLIRKVEDVLDCGVAFKPRMRQATM